MKTLLILSLFITVNICISAQVNNPQTIHIMVALCDNQYHGIVKVPKGIGNGQDPNSNLYWGCGYGVRTHFRKSAEWKEVKRYKVNDIILERIIFKHTTKEYYLIADAYDGRNISDCTIDFLKSCAGSKKDTLMVGKRTLGINGNARLVSYVGHNGLMDFSLANTYENTDGKKRDAIIIACYSKRFFTPYLRSAKANPLVWSTHLMSAEAYTVHDAISAYIKGQTSASVREAAASAYNKYQKCGINGARRLLVSGF